VHLVEIQACARDQPQPARVCAADGHGLRRAAVNHRRGVGDERSHRATPDAASWIQRPDAESRPLGFVDDFPRRDPLVRPVPGDDRRDDAIEQRGPRARVCQNAPPAARLHAADDLGARAPQEIEQREDDAHVEPRGKGEGGVDIGEHERVEGGWRAVRVEDDAGAAVTEQKPPDEIDADRGESRERVRESGVWRRGESAGRLPDVGAEVTAVASPRQVGAEDESGRLEEHARPPRGP